MKKTFLRIKKKSTLLTNSPVAQNPSKFRDTLASAVALTSPEIRTHCARCVSIGVKPLLSIKQTLILNSTETFFDAQDKLFRRRKYKKKTRRKLNSKPDIIFS